MRVGRGIAPSKPSTLAIPTGGLKVQLDATIAASITKDASNNVSQWSDQSGNGNHFVTSFAGTSYLPKYNSALIGSVPGIDFSAVSQSMLQCGGLTALTRNNYSVVVLGGRKSGSPNPWILWDRVNNKHLLTTANGSSMGYSQAIYGREVFPMGALDVLGYTNDGAPHHYWNGKKFPNYVKNDGSLTGDTGNFGNQVLLGSNPNATAIRVAGLLIYNRALSDKEMATIFSVYAKGFGLSNSRARTGNIVHDGDSIARGQGAYATPYYYKSTIDAGYTAADVTVAAIGGQILSQIISSAPTNVDAFYDSTLAAKKNVVVVNCLANTVSSDTDANVQSQLQSYCAARRTAGWKVVVLTCLPRGDKNAAYETSRIAINSWVRSNYATFADALADCGGDATIGVSTATSNNTYYQDTVHPTDAGHAIIAGYVTTAIQAVMA